MILPRICALALQLPHICPHGVERLTAHNIHFVTLSKVGISRIRLGICNFISGHEYRFPHVCSFTATNCMLACVWIPLHVP